MIERAIYDEDTKQWHRPDDPHQLRPVIASTYPEAFEKLYGHAPVIPPPQRAPHRTAEQI